MKPNFGQRICSRICGDKIPYIIEWLSSPYPIASLRILHWRANCGACAGSQRCCTCPSTLPAAAREILFAASQTSTTTPGHHQELLSFILQISLSVVVALVMALCRRSKWCCSRRTWRHACMHISKNCHGIKVSHMKVSTWMLGGPETQLQKQCFELGRHPSTAVKSADHSCSRCA